MGNKLGKKSSKEKKREKTNERNIFPQTWGNQLPWMLQRLLRVIQYVPPALSKES